jgi:hypothetical protein
MMRLTQAAPYKYFTFRRFELTCLRFSAFFKTLRPFFKFLSAASLLALYSILFCSKFGSFKYSSKDPTRETGAYVKGVGEASRKQRWKNYVFQTRDGYIKQILKLFCHSKKLNRIFSLFAKMSIDYEGLFRVDMRHFEVVL